MKTPSLLFALSCFCFVAQTFAFDVNTHTAMTSEAIKQSAIGSNPNASVIIKKLGLFDRPEFLGAQYIDIGASLTRRTSAKFERDVIAAVGDTKTGLTIPHELSLSGWIIRGAIREDDNSIETPQGGSNGAGDEPGGVFERVYNHFFDPANDRPLTVNGVAFGNRSPDWALNKGTVSAGHTNNYNLPSAREAMWRALTGKTWIAGSVGSDIELTGDAQIYQIFPLVKGVALGLPTWRDMHNAAIEQFNYSGYTTPVLANFRA